MQKIPSFTVDHRLLLRGLYVSRRDTLSSGDMVTTFDVRMTEPNRQQPIAPPALHAMEHLAATFMRNHPVWGHEIIYWGPMGCCTGNYLLVKGDRTPADVLPLIIETMEFITCFEGDIPGASPIECGNYTFMDLAGARLAAAEYLEVLKNSTPQNFSYPETTSC